MLPGGFDISFQGMPLWIAGPLAALCAFAVWRYYSGLKAAEFHPAWLPAALRGAALALAVFLSAGPVVKFDIAREVPPRAAIVADSSQSMMSKDGGGEERWTRALWAAEKISRALGGETAAFFIAADAVMPLTSVEDARSLRPVGPESFIAAIPDEIAKLSDIPFTDIVILTDGRDTSGARPPALGGPRAHIVGFGASAPKFNAGVSELSMPEYGFEGEEFEARGFVHVTNSSGGEKFDVELYDGETRAETLTLNAPSGGGDSRLPFALRHKPSESGLRAMTARVRSAAADSAPEDDSRSACVDVASARRKLLYIDSTRWEYKFLQGFLSGLEAMEADVLLIGPAGAMKGAELRGAASSARALSEYNLIIAGAVSPWLKPAERDALAEYAERGGRLIVLGGRNSLAGAGGRWSSSPLAPGSTAGYAAGFEVTATSTGLSGPLLRLADSEADNRLIWKTLPLAQTFSRAEPPPDASVHAEHPWLNCGARRCPMIMDSRWGRGRVLLFAFEGLWRWKFRDREKDAAAYDRIMSNALTMMLETESPAPVRLFMSARESTLGSKLVATAHVEPAALAGGETPLLSATAPGEKSVEIPMTPLEGRPSAFSAEFVPGRAGVHYFAASASGGVSEPRPVAIHASPSEFRNPSADVAFMKRMAELNGGRYFAEADAGEVAAAIRKGAARERASVKKSLWNMPALFALVAALLTAEWVARRRGGLV
jgi:hypothetical protein